MKITNILLILVMIVTLSFAENNFRIDAQIQAIQEAPASERVELMNQFKIQLSNMNAEDRTVAISQMQTKMQAQEHSGSNNNMSQSRAGEHVTQMQMNENDDMSKIQNMSQQQAGSQFGHDVQTSGGSHDMDTQLPVVIPPSRIETPSSGEGIFGERH